MEGKINFKGYKYVVLQDETSNIIVRLNDRPKVKNGFFQLCVGYSLKHYSLKHYTLHTNPDHKESKEMNEHILLVMKYLDDKNSVSKQELKESAANAYAANAAAAYAANAVANAVANAEKWVNKYFDRTKEDKQTYIDAINAGKESKEMKSDRLADEIMQKGKESVYTQEMKDNSEVPVVGMMVLSRGEALEVISVYHIADAKVLTLFNSKTSGVRALYFKTAEVINIDVIDQHTDSEKAIDDIDLSITDTNNSLTDTYKLKRNFGTESIALLQKIKAGEVYGVSFTGDKK